MKPPKEENKPDVNALIDQLKNSPELVSALAELVTKQQEDVRG